MRTNEPTYSREITERAALLEIPFGRRKKEHDVGSGSTIDNQADPRAVQNQRRSPTLKAAMLALVVALVAIVTTSTISWKKRIITAIVAAAIAVLVSVFVPGCMATTNIDGKEYSWRLDVLAPIGATVPKPEWETAQPIYIQAAPPPTSQPAPLPTP